MITTVIFDLDDTLYDEIDFCRSGFRAAARTLPHYRTLFGRRGLCDSGSASSRATAARPSTSPWPSSASPATPLMQAGRDLSHAHADADSAAESRAASKTSRTVHAGPSDRRFLPTQRLKVQALGIEHYFKAIMYTEELGREFWKPSPRGFENFWRGSSPPRRRSTSRTTRQGFYRPQSAGPADHPVAASQRPVPAAVPPAGGRTELKIGAIGDLAGILAGFAECP